MKATLNEIEQQVYDALVCNARCYDENGNGCCFDDIDYKGMGLTFQQVKGYLSQLCQKGYIQVQRDGYFTHEILKWANIMTREQVIDFVRREIECGDSVLSSTAGNGGAGGILVSNPAFAAYLESLEYVGPVEPIDDIMASPCYDPSWHTYQFNGANGFFVQIQAF